MFDKEKFKNLLEKARGDRSNEDYSRDSGVSRAYISNFLNLKRDIPPTPDILKKLAETAYGNVTYRDFMDAAGYLNLDEVNKEIITLETKLKEIYEIICVKRKESEVLRQNIQDLENNAGTINQQELIMHIDIWQKQIEQLEQEFYSITCQLDQYKEIRIDIIDINSESCSKEGVVTSSNSDIREIARAGNNMTSDEAAELRKFAERLFPDAFKKNS
ncbi:MULTISPECIES: transcriptional regulator [unclassified Dehalobacter]|uniref:transcriptional regulator n=1 Tax=unclassified Dehalobacter TaxID=2635733 RepID=UPI00028AC9C5|nr:MULTISPECIES: transcriptional regulator [unclassified Dehalobacter]AFV02843.1 hypothetical protein DHBDCA_p1817 [Dehalobacter sp. DCA]AFV05830.1 hypothetical protein DCF50_p1828 [Dehalobacter sp. CF]